MTSEFVGDEDLLQSVQLMFNMQELQTSLFVQNRHSWVDRSNPHDFLIYIFDECGLSLVSQIC
jgi:hypothetical protein